MPNSMRRNMNDGMPVLTGRVGQHTSAAAAPKMDAYPVDLR
jgi:hypothetical protein